MLVCHTEFLQNKAEVEVEVENVIVTEGVKSLQWHCNLLRSLTHCCCDVSAGHSFSLQGQQEASFNRWAESNVLSGDLCGWFRKV